nr:MAG TPA: Late nodulin protein [Bacteriophage sp.]
MFMYVMILFLLLYYVCNDTITYTMYALYNIKRNVLLYTKYPS